MGPNTLLVKLEEIVNELEITQTELDSIETDIPRLDSFLAGTSGKISAALLEAEDGIYTLKNALANNK